MTGIYPPQVRVYEVSELSLKFERHLTSEIIDFQVWFEFFLGSFCFKGTWRKAWNWVQSVAWNMENVVWVAGTSRWLFQTGLFVRRSICVVACKIWQLLQYSDSKVGIIHCTIFFPTWNVSLYLELSHSFLIWFSSFTNLLQDGKGSVLWSLVLWFTSGRFITWSLPSKFGTGL